MRGKYKLAGMVAVILTVIAAGGLMLHLMDSPAAAVAEDNAEDEATYTIVDDAGDVVEDTRTDADLEAAYQAGVPAYEGDQRYIDYVIDRTIEDAPDHVEMYGKTFGVLENGETFGRPASYVDEDGHQTSWEPDYQTAIGTNFASDGALVWIKMRNMLTMDDIHTPGESAYAAAHPRVVQYPLYAKPGGEVYEYKTQTIGGVQTWSEYEKCNYVVITLVDGTQLEFSMADYLADPSILDDYDVRYLFASNQTLEKSGYVSPARDRDYDTLDGAHLLVKLRDNSIVDIPIDDYYANPDILDQYEGNIRDIIRTEKSLTEYETMGVAEELFW